MEPQTQPPGYRITLRPAAELFLRKLRDANLGRRIDEAITDLGAQPRPPGAKMLSGHEQIWRIRVGHYRILYQIDDSSRLIRIAQIGHRREIYR